MSYMATVSFSGIISMHKGEVREISDSSHIEDLTKAGYIIPYESTKEEKPKSTKRKGKTNE